MARPFLTNELGQTYDLAVSAPHTSLAARLRSDPGNRALYLRLADALAEVVQKEPSSLPSARALAAREGFNRATVNAAYRELARRGLLVIRRGRPRKHLPPPPVPTAVSDGEVPAEGIDLARYAPDAELLPSGRVFRWLGVGEGEGESVAQYGCVAGYAPLRRWLASHLRTLGIEAAADSVLLTSGVQHALDLLLRAMAAPGDAVLVEDPTYPGLPPLLAIHGLRAVGLSVGANGIDVDALDELLARHRPRLAIVTPTLHNPSGLVWAEATRRSVLHCLQRRGCQIVEEFFDPALVVEGPVPPPLAATDPRVILVGSFSKALFPGLRVGWLHAPQHIVAAVAAVKRATDLSGSPFLEATAYQLCERGILAEQFARLRRAARARWATVSALLRGAPEGVRWSVPQGGFSTLVALPRGWSAQGVAAHAAQAGVWVVPGRLMSVSGRDDVVRVAFAAVGGEHLEMGIRRFLRALEPAVVAAPLA